MIGVWADSKYQRCTAAVLCNLLLLSTRVFRMLQDQRGLLCCTRGPTAKIPQVTLDK